MQQATLESIVARPAPIVSIPFGRRTNMNSGSRAILRIPPMETPNPACLAQPTLRKSPAMVICMTVGTAPITITQNAYCRAYGRVSGLAPSPVRSLSIKIRNIPAYKRPLRAAA